jgi:hypothetical protein
VLPINHNHVYQSGYAVERRCPSAPGFSPRQAQLPVLQKNRIGFMLD